MQTNVIHTYIDIWWFVTHICVFSQITLNGAENDSHIKITNYYMLRQFKMSEECIYCGYVMPKIGDKRANGVGCDWDGRRLHKKCIREAFTIREALCVTLDILVEADEKKKARKIRRKLTKFCNVYGLPIAEPTYNEQLLLFR
jgi:hypothetical protein